MNFIIHNLGLLCIYFVLVQSYNLTLGSLGIMHLGQIGFYALGAYGSTLLTMNGMPYIVAVPLAMLMGAVCGFVIGIPCLKIKGHYLALATLGLSEIIRLILLNWIDFTQGPLGIRAIPKPDILGIIFTTKLEMLGLYMVITALALLIMYRIMHSPYGKVLEAIREDEIAAASLGKNVIKYKMQVFTISAAFAALAGSMYAHFYTYIDPSIGKLPAMMFVLTMLIFGGTGSFWGAIVGPTIIVSVFEGLRLLPLASEYVGPVQYIIYGLVLILLILYRPQGIMGKRKLTGE